MADNPTPQQDQFPTHKKWWKSGTIWAALVLFGTILGAFAIAPSGPVQVTPVEYSNADTTTNQEPEASQGLDDNPASENSSTTPQEVASPEEPTVPTADERREILPTMENMQVAQACADSSRIPGGGYCVDWYFVCLEETFGKSSLVRLGIPQEPMFYNQMCLSYGKKPSDLSPRPRG